jgi:hypothetical protein
MLVVAVVVQRQEHNGFEQDPNVGPLDIVLH